MVGNSTTSAPSRLSAVANCEAVSRDLVTTTVRPNSGVRSTHLRCSRRPAHSPTTITAGAPIPARADASASVASVALTVFCAAVVAHWTAAAGVSAGSPAARIRSSVARIRAVAIRITIVPRPRAAACKDKWIAALEPDHDAAHPRALDQHRVQFGLLDTFSRAAFLAGVNQLGFGRREPDQFRTHQVVVNHDVGAAESVSAAKRDEIGGAGTRTNEEDYPPIPMLGARAHSRPKNRGSVPREHFFREPHPGISGGGRRKIGRERLFQRLRQLSRAVGTEQDRRERERIAHDACPYADRRRA